MDQENDLILLQFKGFLFLRTIQKLSYFLIYSLIYRSFIHPHTNAHKGNY